MQMLVKEGLVDARGDVSASSDVKLGPRKAAACGTSEDWTLVDYLFPVPKGEQHRKSCEGFSMSAPERMANSSLEA
jgi:hypothetical protein